MNENSFNVVNREGLEVTCDTLMILHPTEINNPDVNETYIIYTDYTLDDNNNFNIYISTLLNNENGVQLGEVKNFDQVPELLKAMENAYNELNK